MLTRRTTLALPAALAFARRAAAQMAPSVTTAVAKAALVDPTDTGADIENQMQDWIARSGFEARNGKDLVVVSKTSSVLLPSSNPAWVRARMIAFADALLEAQAEFVGSKITQTLTETVKDFVKNGDNPPPYNDVRTPGQAADALRKLVALANGKLDQQLQSLGIDPKQYEQAPEPQKTALLSNHLKQQTVEKSFGALAGMVPVQTFEGTDGKGNYQIGVVAVASPKMADFASQVITARGEFTPDPAQAQDLSKLTADIGQLIHDFGVRRVFDEQGLPVIVSFAQWGSAYRGTDPGLAASYRDAARQQAQAWADAQIGDFLKGTMAWQKTAAAGRQQDDIASSMPDSVAETSTTEIMDMVKRHLQRSSSVALVGVRTLRSWTGRHPASPVPIVGVVRAWSAASEQGMRALAAPRPATPARAAAGGKDEPAGVTQGRSLMDSSDF